MRPSTQLHTTHCSCNITPEKVEEDEHHPNAMLLRGSESGIDVSEHELIRRAGSSAIVVFNSRSAITKKKPSNVIDSGCSKLLEGGLQLRELVRLRDAATGAPRVGAKIDPVVNPGEIGAD